jgi:hypothetical protein
MSEKATSVCCVRGCGGETVAQGDNPQHRGKKINLCADHYYNDYIPNGEDQFCREHPECVGGPPSPV